MSSSSSSSTMCSQGAVLATALAVSGTVILIAVRLHKSQFPLPHQPLRPCLSSSEGGEREKTKKRVQFAEEVVEPRGDDGKRSRRKQQANNNVNMENNNKNKNKERGMPANRVALYNGILRDRLVQRLAYSC